MSDRLKPYRVEWRPDLNARWLIMREADTHEGALAVSDEVRGQHQGQTRVVSQHVIDVRGFNGIGGGQD